MKGKVRFVDDARSCKICNNSTGNRQFTAQEKMLGSGGEFDYMECGSCKAIMLMTPPADMAPYYPSDYYSFSDITESASLGGRLKGWLMQHLIEHRLGSSDRIGSWLAKWTTAFKWVRQDMFDRNTAILDVGCGNGALLSLMAQAGFMNLRGADPFIEADINYRNGVRIYKRELQDVEGEFGFIMLNHTFEHLEDPQKVLETLSDKLEPGGKAMIRIPVGDCWAWEHYGTDWVQLDAPRHFFLHTERSIRHLVQPTDLTLEHVEYDSTIFQFVGSEKYQQGLTLNDNSKSFSRKKINEFRSKAEDLNMRKRGDTTSFYLTKVQ